ncbi:Tetraspanin 39D [Carabus blaptoides fortunei]
MIFGIKVIKILLFIFNFIFAIFGIAILALGVVYKLQIEVIITYLGDDFPIAPDLFIAIGTVAFIVSFFGCIGASRENRAMLISFVILLVILLVIELAVVIIAFVEISNGKVEKHITTLIEKEKENGNLHRVEEKLECCGITGPSSYISIIPKSCYKEGVQTEENLFSTGCLQRIHEIFYNIGKQLGAIAITIAVIEIIGALLALTKTSAFVLDSCCKRSLQIPKGKMGCAAGLVKAIMFIFNFLFVLAGLALIGIGTLFFVKLETYDKVVVEQFKIAPTLMLIVGVVVFIIAFFGCCGVCRESYCMLVTYAVLLLTIFALQLAIGIYAYVQVKEDGDVRPLVERSLESAFVEYEKSNEVREVFDVMQKEFRCCGVNGPQDYIKNLITIPASCCSEGNLNCVLKGSVTTGCATRISENITASIKTVAYVAIGVAAVEIIGSIFAMCLASTLKNESRRRYP